MHTDQPLDPDRRLLAGEPVGALDHLLAWSLRNKALIVIALLVLTAVGVEAARRLPIDAVPDVTNVQVQILTDAPGLAPLDVERFITTPVELAMTGLPHLEEVRGTVVHGDKLGRVLGWPTANMWFGRHLEPARGVYAVTVALPDGSVAKGVANVGRRPTLGGDPKTRLETFIFDYAGDLYGQEIGVRLVHFLRPDAKFAGLEDLKAAIAQDVEDAKAVLG